MDEVRRVANGYREIAKILARWLKASGHAGRYEEFTSAIERIVPGVNQEANELWCVLHSAVTSITSQKRKSKLKKFAIRIDSALQDISTQSSPHVLDRIITELRNFK